MWTVLDRQPSQQAALVEKPEPPDGDPTHHLDGYCPEDEIERSAGLYNRVGVCVRSNIQEESYHSKPGNQ